MIPKEPLADFLDRIQNSLSVGDSLSLDDQVRMLTLVERLSNIIQSVHSELTKLNEEV